MCLKLCGQILYLVATERKRLEVSLECATQIESNCGNKKRRVYVAMMSSLTICGVRATEFY